MKPSFSRIIKHLIEFIFGVMFASLVLAWPLQLLWNWLIVDLFSLQTITLLQAWGLRFLVGLLISKSDSGFVKAPVKTEANQEVKNDKTKPPVKLFY